MYFDKRLFVLTRGQRWRIGLAAGVGLLGLPIGIARLVLSGLAIAWVIQGRSFGEVVPLLVAVAVLTAARAGVQLLKEEIANRTAGMMKLKIRDLIYRQVLALGPGPFDQRRTGAVLLALVDGVEQLETFYGLYLPQLIVAGLTPFVLFGFMAFLDLPTAVIYLVFSILALALPSILHRWNYRAADQRREAYSELGADFVDGIQGLATLKSFGQSRARGALLADRARSLYRGTMAVLAANCATGGLTLFFIAAGAGLALAWGAIRVSEGTLPLTTLVILLMLGVEIFRPLREMTALYHRGMLAMSASRAIYDVLDMRPEVVDPASQSRVPSPESRVHSSESEVQGLRSKVQGDGATRDPGLGTRDSDPAVAFEGVSFGYPGRGWALEQVSFTLRAGEMLGLVGPSGAGKSTVVWLLLRFFDPQVGRILLGGRDLRELPLEEVRRQFAVVAQDTYLFHGTVADNLRFGKPEATESELETAARAANAHEFIMALPHGYETVVGERGARLSGGQRQRIAIARALLKDAPILLLDEALSSVDAENEASIQEALERLQRGRTTLVIAHRLSSVINADRILVLEQGRLVESGRHSELARAGGVYSRLMAEQAAEAGIDERISERWESGVGSRESGDGRVSTGVLQFGSSQRPGEHHPVLTPNPPSPTPDSRPPTPDSGLLPAAEVWRRLLGLVRPWWGQLAITFLLGLARAVAVVGLAVVSALIVRRVALGEPFGDLLVVLALLVPGHALLTWLENWIAHDLAYSLLAEMRIAMYEALDPLAPAYFQRRRSGDLTSTATGDVELIEYFFAHTISPTLIAIIVPAGVLIGLALLAWPLELALLPFLLIVAFSPLLAQRSAERISARARALLGELNALMVDSVQGLRTIAAFQRGEQQVAAIFEHGRRFNREQLAFLRNQAVHNAVVEVGTGYGGLAVLATGAWLAAQGQIDRPTLALASVTALASFSPLTDLAKTAKDLAGTLAAGRRIFAIHDEPVPVRDGPGVSGADGRIESPRLRFDGVSFAYGPDLPRALREVSFEVEPGQLVALVGRSGAGKTTLAHLVLRFWDPQDGRILLGDYDLRDFRLDDLRRQVALVAQDTYLFNTTVRENLLLGRPEASEGELKQAARQANALEFVESLPDGYETTIGERGFHLSGGQRQRLALARAVLKDAPVLILDEATSHLDAVSERQVHAALEELMRGRTTLVIAHRLSTVRRADRIVVLDDGAVVEQGTHEELLARGGTYAQLVSTQLAGQAGGRAAARETGFRR